MRIVISGTHGTGKSTLAHSLAARWPAPITVVDEPYEALQDDGHEFELPPSPEDYRLMLEHSISSLCAADISGDVIFDRSPLDFLAYLIAVGEDPWVGVDPARLRAAFATLDLVVIAPIAPDAERVLPRAEHRGLRRRANEALLDLIDDDPMDAWSDTPVLELTGPPSGWLALAMRALPRR